VGEGVSIAGRGNNHGIVVTGWDWQGATASFEMLGKVVVGAPSPAPNGAYGHLDHLIFKVEESGGGGTVAASAYRLAGTSGDTDFNYADGTLSFAERAEGFWTANNEWLHFVWVVDASGQTVCCSRCPWKTAAQRGHGTLPGRRRAWP